jgi:hypothetical protein
MKLRAALAIVPALVAGLAALPAQAGVVTLEMKEFPALRKLVADDPGAAAQFAKVRAEAEEAMGEKPAPVELLDGAGRRPDDPIRIRSRAAVEQIRKTEALTWTWAVTGDLRYAQKAREIIAAWVRVNRTVGQPINETGLEPLVEAYDMIRVGYPDRERAQVDAWLRDRARAIWEHPKGRKENWHSHRIKMVGLIAATIGDDKLWRTAVEGYRWQLGDNFEPNGASVDFRRRDAMSYHLYTVQPLLILACVAERRGDPLFGYRASNGVSLERTVEFVKPYALGEKKHTEFANTVVKADHERAEWGQEHYKPHEWNPRESVRTFTEASCVKPSYAAVAAQVAGTPKQRFVDWRSVVIAAMPPERRPR